MDNDKVSENITKVDKVVKKPVDKKTRIGIVVFVLGVITLMIGIVMSVMNFLSIPAERDAELLVKVGTWEREDANGVIWTFTEIGKGTLTTNSHENDYNFIWAIEDGKLKIETAWLYELNDEYDYEIDSGNKTLTLLGEDETSNIVFKAVSSQEGEQ